MALVLLLTGANALDAVRLDAQFSDNYLASIEQMAAVAKTMPDTNGDGKIILMVEDPYILRFVGIQSIMFPTKTVTKSSRSRGATASITC